VKVQAEFPFEKKSNSNAIESKYLEDLRESWNIYQKEQIGKTAKSNQTHVCVQQKKSQNIKKALERLSRSFLKEINEVWTKIVTKFAPQSTEDKLLASADL